MMGTKASQWWTLMAMTGYKMNPIPFPYHGETQGTLPLP